MCLHKVKYLYCFDIILIGQMTLTFFFVSVISYKKSKPYGLFINCLSFCLITSFELLNFIIFAKMKSIIFLVFLISFVTSEDFFRANCHEVINTNSNCRQLIWEYPNCVPWDTTKCKLRRVKKKTYCINYDCSVSFVTLFI